MSNNPLITDFVDRAEKISVTEAADLLGVKFKPNDKGGPCPAPGCGGKDRFSINSAKQSWHCRKCGGGSTAIGLAALVLDVDIGTQSGFLAACAELLDEPVPEGGAVETEKEKAEREARRAKRQADADDKAAERERNQKDRRAREVQKARGIYLNASVVSAGTGLLGRVLRLRAGFDLVDGVFEYLRLAPRQTYWHGSDERGNPVSHYVGPAMIAPFIVLDDKLDGRIVGCHQTWVDEESPPKYRPNLGLDAHGDPLPSKKMRGTKKGGLIPLCGAVSATRWVGGEGIENGLAIAGFEGFRGDTFYFAAGDLGNLAGPAAEQRRHPSLRKDDKLGRSMPVTVPGDVPKPEQGPDDALQIPDHVTALVLLADGDSEFFFTACAMTRAKVRNERPGRDVAIWWPPSGYDWSRLMAERMGTIPK